MERSTSNSTRQAVFPWKRGFHRNGPVGDVIRTNENIPSNSLDTDAHMHTFTCYNNTHTHTHTLANIHLRQITVVRYDESQSILFHPIEQV